jgi:hypothetical protein
MTPIAEREEPQTDSEAPAAEPRGRGGFKPRRLANGRPDIWTRYRVRFEFLTKVCGQTPDKPEMIQAWIDNRMPRVAPPGARSIDEINAEALASLARGEGLPDTEFSSLIFQRAVGGVDDGKLAFRHGTIRAHIKECARTLSNQFVAKFKGERAFSTRVINGLYLEERQYWIPLQRADGSRLTVADGNYEKPVHPKGPRGETLSALKRFEFVEPPAFMEFTIKVLGDSIAEDDLHYIFTYGGTHGYAGERGDGEGRYDYTFSPVGPDASIA